MASSEANVSSRATPLGENDPRTLGTYTLLGKLGQGGMGTVYLGRSELGRLVAIKVVRADVADDAQFRSRFRQEAATARRVARVCTAEVLDFDPEAEQPYLVTEFIEGPTLQSFVGRGGPLADANLEQLAVGVAAALRAIHAAGIVHRDLKPSNVVLSPFGPRVIDFGIARALDSGAGLTGDLQQLGTPAFMSPEQIRGDAITSKADIWAWGGLVTFAATGHYPFGMGSAQVLLFRALNEEPRLDGVDPGLHPIVWDAMRKNPYERPNASQLMDRLLGDTGDTADQGEQVTNVLADWRLPNPAPGTVPSTTGGAGQGDYATLAATRPGYNENYVPTQVATQAAGAPSVGTGPTYGQPPPPAPPAKKRSRRPLIIGAAAAVIVIAILAAVLPNVLGKDKGGAGNGDVAAFLPRSAAPLGLDTLVFTQKKPGEAHYQIVSAQVPAAGGLLSNVRTVAANDQDDLTVPAISPDRKTVFYLDKSAGGNILKAKAADGSGEPVVLFTSGPAKQLTIPEDSRPSIAPDGRSLVIRSTSGPPVDGQSKAGLYLVAMDGSTVRRLNTEPQASDPSYSPVGEQIAYWSNNTGGDGGFLVVVSDFVDAKPQPLNKVQFLKAQDEGRSPDVDADSVWSPDGKRLAFKRQIAGDENNQQIFVMDVGSRTVTQITNDSPGQAHNQDPAWATNNDLIFTKVNPDNGDRQIFVVNPNNLGAGSRQLTTESGYHGQPRWNAG
ncbi:MULTISPECIES: protein kinase domain-containing protein [unclassified Pseudofrankia]|uniref:protein kinase domain-containing protein n=1 Tax=unclassified Pseudofrankia TaxID=2994372 RepID=UPI0008DA627D|nr:MULTISPECIES: protein kinase [unclassified Pseudofrankia]MDT3438762.1 protein kinase [Pseudofrankia sp. BMG5.37]OHV73026.1 serine/threonine protein kinase [Pseudofrankia sp. BMG5.36]